MKTDIPNTALSGNDGGNSRSLGPIFARAVYAYSEIMAAGAPPWGSGPDVTDAAASIVAKSTDPMAVLNGNNGGA